MHYCFVFIKSSSGNEPDVFVRGYLITNIYFTVTHAYYDDLISKFQSLNFCSKHRYKYEIVSYRSSNFTECFNVSDPFTLKIEAINVFETLRKFFCLLNASYCRT